MLTGEEGRACGYETSCGCSDGAVNKSVLVDGSVINRGVTCVGSGRPPGHQRVGSPGEAQPPAGRRDVHADRKQGGKTIVHQMTALSLIGASASTCSVSFGEMAGSRWILTDSPPSGIDRVPITNKLKHSDVKLKFLIVVDEKLTVAVSRRKAPPDKGASKKHRVTTVRKGDTAQDRSPGVRERQPLARARDAEAHPSIQVHQGRRQAQVLRGGPAVAHDMQDGSGGSGRWVLATDVMAMVCIQVGFRGKHVVTALAVAKAESDFDAANTNYAAASGKWGPAVGRFQIRELKNPRLRAEPDGLPSRPRLDEGLRQQRFDYDLRSGGKHWGCWSAYTNGAYRKYVTQARE